MTSVRVTQGFDLVAFGERVRSERVRQRLSLDALAARSEVSRSMLSAVESGGKAPTVLVLHRIAAGLGTTMSRLLGDEDRSPVVLLRRADQVVARANLVMTSDTPSSNIDGRPITCVASSFS